MPKKRKKEGDRELRKVREAGRDGQVAGAMNQEEADRVLKEQKDAGIRPLTECPEELRDYRRDYTKWRRK